MGKAQVCFRKILKALDSRLTWTLLTDGDKLMHQLKKSKRWTALQSMKIILNISIFKLTFVRPPTYSHRGMFLSEPNVSSDLPPLSSRGRNMEDTPL